MKKLKRSIQIVFILLTLCFLLRGWIYRKCISYSSIGERITYPISDSTLQKYIENNSAKEYYRIEDIIDRSLYITSQNLKFKASKNVNDPNQLIHTKKAHCVGYASFFTTTCNYLITQNKLANQWVANHQIGQMYLLNKNIHQYLNHPFFQDHDFVTIENIYSGKVYVVDPSLYDYLYIDYVRIRADN